MRLSSEHFSLRLPPGYPASGTTALLIPVPEAEPVFRRWSGARIGVPGLPPHVTVLYPFMPESELDADRVFEFADGPGAACGSGPLASGDDLANHRLRGPTTAGVGTG